MPNAASSALAVLGPSARFSGSLSVVTSGSIGGQPDNSWPRGDDPLAPPHFAALRKPPVRAGAGASGRLRRLPVPPAWRTRPFRNLVKWSELWLPSATYAA